MKKKNEQKCLSSAWVVTVTYGDRYRFLEQAVHAALSNGAGQIVVVDNGSHPACRSALAALENQCRQRLKVLHLDGNKGSAKGYKVGISYAASQSECEFIWLLDDDNVPEEEALQHLFRNYFKLLNSGIRKPFALLSLREEGRSHFQKLARGIPAEKVFPLNSSFRGFHIFKLPYRIYFNIRNKFFFPTNQDNSKIIHIPYAPWGGLFFHKKNLDYVGLPEEKFYLYSDDREFTYRFTKQGKGIYLVLKSIVHDIDLSSHNMPKGNNDYKNLILGDIDYKKTYYLLRNNAYFQKYYWSNSQFLFVINKFLFLFILACYAIKNNRWNRFIFVFKAIQESKSLNII